MPPLRGPFDETDDDTDDEIFACQRECILNDLQGTWNNIDFPREQYVVEGLRVTRTDPDWTCEFTIRWDQREQQWHWGTRGRLRLRWLGYDEIAWVPAISTHHSETPATWRWQRCSTSVPQSICVTYESYGRETRTRHIQRSGHPYSQHHRDYSRNDRQSRVDPTERLENGLTQDDVYELLSRDLTPEDYEILLQLDDAIEKPKPTVSADIAQNLPKIACEDFMGDRCTVCQMSFDVNDTVVALQCGHNFHADCIATWLTTYRKTCPLCFSDALPTQAEC